MAVLKGRSVCGVMGEMTWPAITGCVADLGWRLRYAPEGLTREDQLVLASIVDAWVQMVQDPQRKRNAVCKEIAAASRETRA